MPDTDSLRRVSAVVPVFRDAAGAVNAARRLLAQSLPGGVALEVVVVDDGSGDGTAERLREMLPAGVKLLALPENRGRSAARQAGVDVTTGQAILFLDCDCEPTEDTYVLNHLIGLEHGAIASVGPVIGLDGGFWDRYQREASDRRRESFKKGARYSGSSQNMLVRAGALRSAGGFEARYRHYGFEDRDVLVRMAELGRIVWCDAAVVRHRDRISMISVSAKMQAAGRESSRLFAKRHPAAYRALGYAAVDAHERPWLLRPARAVARILGPVSAAFDVLERNRLLPWAAGFYIARLISAASYLAGTADAQGAEADPDPASDGHIERTERL